MKADKRRGRIPYNISLWTRDEVQLLRDNYLKMTNPQLAKLVHKKLTVTRNKLRELGLCRTKRPKAWTKTQEEFLRKHYTKMGDVEIAELMNRRWPRKDEVWTRKRMAKKRDILGLHRTQNQIQAILMRNKAQKRYTTQAMHEAYLLKLRRLDDDYIVANCLRISKLNREEVKKNHTSLIEFTRQRIAHKRELKARKEATHGTY